MNQRRPHPSSRFQSIRWHFAASSIAKATFPKARQLLLLWRRSKSTAPRCKNQPAAKKNAVGRGRFFLPGSAHFYPIRGTALTGVAAMDWDADACVASATTRAREVSERFFVKARHACSRRWKDREIRVFREYLAVGTSNRKTDRQFPRRVLQTGVHRTQEANSFVGGSISGFRVVL